MRAKVGEGAVKGERKSARRRTAYEPADWSRQEEASVVACANGELGQGRGATHSACGATRKSA